MKAREHRIRGPPAARGLAVPGTTVRKAYDIASGVFKLAVRDRLISVSPARDIHLPTTHKTERRFLTMAEVDRILEAIDPRFRVLVLTAVHSGPRVGELAGLTVDAVDMIGDR